MGTAMLKAFLQTSGVSKTITISDPNEGARARAAELGVESVFDNRRVAAAHDVLLIGTEPEDFSEVLQELHTTLDSSKLIISIAAGIRTKDLQSQMAAGVRVARVMPNTPCVVGEMAAGFCLGEGTSTPEDIATVKHLLSACGNAQEVEERLMDAVTGLSGSGPAYVFNFIEALADGGVRAGLPREVALQLAAQTVRGAATMVLETGEHPGKLKDQVTSPGGTTIAGVHQLEQGAFRGTVMNAVFAAASRSKELGARADE
jgi:pyrroline-5-carboxylate reductase